MTEEINSNLEQQTTAEDYINVIQDLKANSVSKADYDRIREENRQLLNSLVNGSYQAQEESEEEHMRSSADIKKDLFTSSNKSMTNLEYITLACELRDAVLAETEGKEDCFTVHRSGEKPSEEALASAQRTADVFKQCIEDCDGDPQMFNAILQQRMQDVSRAGRR